MSVLDALGFGLSAADTIAGNTINAIQNFKNMQLQQATLDWQKQAQQNTWDREDTAIQRRVKDLQASGLSATLAAGSGASTSQPLTPITPQSNFEYMAGFADALSNAINTARQVVDIDAVNAGIVKTKSETAEANARTISFNLDALLKQNELSLFDIKKLNLERDAALKEVSAAKSEQEKQKLIKEVRNYDNIIKRTELENARLSIDNKKALQDLMIMQNTGVSSSDLGTKGMMTELLKIAKGAGNKLDFAINNRRRSNVQKKKK